MKKRLYVDMDGVLADYAKAHAEQVGESNQFPQSNYGFFRNLEPINGAIHAVNFLKEKYDIWILSCPSVLNPMCYTEKREWIEKHFGIEMCYKLILATDKSLLKGDYLVDDRNCDNQEAFEGEFIQFGTEDFPDWVSVGGILMAKHIKDFS